LGERKRGKVMPSTARQSPAVAFARKRRKGVGKKTRSTNLFRATLGKHVEKRREIKKGKG